MTSKDLGRLASIGISILLLNALAMFTWAKDYSSDKPFYDAPEIAIGLFAGICLGSAALFRYALSKNGRKSIFIPLLVISLLIGSIGLLAAFFVHSVSQLGT